MNLKEALKSNRLKDFIKARSKEEKKGDKDKFDKAINLFRKVRQKLRKHQLRARTRVESIFKFCGIFC